MRWMKRGLIAFSALGLLLAGALAVNHVVETAQTRNFYSGRKILSAMYQAARAAAEERRSSHGAAKSALMTLLPAGTPKTSATSALSDESVTCERVRDARGDLVCGIWNQPAAVHNWHIELRFDRDDKLADARVLILK